MSFKTKLIKSAIKCTPNKMIILLGNIVLKGIAQLTDFNFDLDARKVYVQTRLEGEQDCIEVWVDGFGILDNGKAKKFVIQQAQSNKPWLNNILARVVGKEWKIPVLPKYATYIALVADVLKLEPEQKVISEN